MGEPATGRYDADLPDDFWKGLPVVAIESVLIMMGLAALAGAAAAVWSARSALQKTTLTAAWRWTLAADLVWTLALVQTWRATADAASTQLAWFAAALIGLCPPIAVLGARRPGANAWTWFVMVPLLAVLGWPALTVWQGDDTFIAPTLETPQMLGFGLVLVMGTGNYVGTRFWASACLYALAVCLAVAPLSAAAPDWVDPLNAWTAGSIFMGLAAAVGAVQSSRRPYAPPGLNRIWEDYRDTFGLVWSRRLQDRLNAVANKQQWPVRATASGFQWDDDTPPQPRAETAAHLEQSVRWMLRRFVAPEWIDQRLGGRTES